jgi:hypothetical protein
MRAAPLLSWGASPASSLLRVARLNLQRTVLALFWRCHVTLPYVRTRALLKFSIPEVVWMPVLMLAFAAVLFLASVGSDLNLPIEP